MKNPRPVAFFAWAACLAPCHGAPETLELVDGRKLEQVTSAVPDDDKIRVVHSSGVMRVPPADFTAASRKALGIRVIDPAAPPPPEIKRLVTLKGKSYEEIRSVRVKPSFMSFVHRDGSASVRFEEVSEDLRKQFSYDKAVADAFDKAREQAETAMRLAEENAAKKAAKAAYSAAIRKSRAQALDALYFTNYGSNRYWLADTRQRDLIDAMMAKSLYEAGFSPDEVQYQLNRARFR